jgi:hypothetical protein
MEKKKTQQRWREARAGLGYMLGELFFQKTKERTPSLHALSWQLEYRRVDWQIVRKSIENLILRDATAIKET